MPATMPPDPLAERFDFGGQLIAEAGALALDFYRRLDSLSVERKGTQDVVSEADVEVEAHIRERLAARFPEDDFFGEEVGRPPARDGVAEGAAQPRGTGQPAAEPAGLWIVDPIDGTLPFVSGLTSWCVSIGYLRGGIIEMGFVAVPARGEIFVGRRGRGATLNGRPIHVSSSTSVDEGLLCIGMSPRVGPDQILAIMEPLLRRGAAYYREGSGALSLAYVAAGRLIGYIEAHINAWDCAGGVALVEAAGGRVNDVLAGEGLWRGGPIAAAPPAIYPVLEALISPPP
jgi:myo-inositol-1(or 4)-monophosphatase